MSQPFNSDQYLRAGKRKDYAKDTASLKALTISLGYDKHVHQLMNAERFHAVVGIYPSEYLDYVRLIFEDVSNVAVDHSKEEVLAILCIVTEAAIEQLPKKPIQDDDQLREVLQEIARDAIIAYEEDCGQPFKRETFPVQKMTLEQARAYIKQWAKQYRQLPGADEV
jgi:hypothetical protein